MKRFAAGTLAVILLTAVLVFLFFRMAHRSTPATAAHPQQIQPSNLLSQNAASATAGAMGTQAGAQRSQVKSLGGQAASVNPQPADGQAPPRKRAWDPEFLASLRTAAEGDPIKFELVEGQQAAGTIGYLEHKNGELIHVAGQLTQPEAGKFFFQKQTQPGVAGGFVGVVEFPGSKKAYRIEPTGPGGAPELVERPLRGVLCLNLPLPDANTTNQIEEIPPLNPQTFPTVPIPDYQNGIIVLESLSGATAVIYLDFQGGYTPTWQTGGITYDRPNVSNAQIRETWMRVSEDYMPFNINVTTDLHVYQRAPEGSRQRVVITPTSTAAPGAGGVSYVGSFDWTGDTPCWVFIIGGKACGEACSHELGHSVGLNHHGQDGPGQAHVEYYGGQGSGETGWAPIMGVGYYMNVSQWSKGEYANASVLSSTNDHQDDIAIISSQNNNVSYRVDDTGDTLATSRYLEIFPNDTAQAEGMIERTADTDAFQFTTSGGTVWLRADPVGVGPNLAIQATLYDANNTLIASNNPQNVLWASLTNDLPAGTYTVRVTGAGRNDPVTSGFSSYASLGYYAVTGTVANARLPSRFAIPENAPNGTLVGVVAPLGTGGDPLIYLLNSGNTGNTFALDNAGNLTVTNNALLDYEALARNTQFTVQFEMFVDIVDALNPLLTETNRRVVVAITNVNEAPTVTGFSASMLEHTLPGASIGFVTGSDPDLYTLLSYSIVSGNSNGMFSIGNHSGVITVVGDANVATQSVYNLAVVASDQTGPSPLTATSTVMVTVVPNNTLYRPGTISYAVYTNISGNLVSALTSSASYPYDPALEKQMTLFEGDSNRGISYGAVMRGYLIAPATGSYTFWIATDDNGELWLSSSTNTASITRIAYISGDGLAAGVRQWNKYASQQSAAVSLVAGQAYYIEARQKQGTGNDNLAVAWQCLSAGISQDVIPGRFLAPYFLNYVPHALGFTYNLHRDAFLGSRLGTVGATDVNTNDSHTFTIGLNKLLTIDSTTGVVRLTNELNLQTTTSNSYLVQVRAIDNGSPPRASFSTLTINIVPTNAVAATAVEQEVWNNIGTGTTISALTNQPNWPKRPDTLRRLTNFDSGQNLGDAYGSRIRAYLTPPSSGSYTFYIASDDNSQLNFNSSGTNAAAASPIAAVGDYTGYQEWTKFSSQKSAPISLVAGQHYYLEALHKEGAGGDHVEVGWTGPALTGTNIIAAAFLTPVDLNYPPDLTNATVQVSITASNGTVLTNLTAFDSPLDLLTYKIVSGNLSHTFALNPETGALTIADNTLIATYLDSSFNLVVQAQDSGYGGLYALRAAQATVTVLVVDNTTPFVWTGGGTNDQWSSGPNWNGTAPGENSKLKFAGLNRQTNYNDLLTQVGQVTFNNSGFNISGNPLLLLAGIFCVGTNTWAINSTLNKPQTFTNGNGTFSFLGSINNNGNLLTLRVANSAMHLDGPMSGAGGLTKSGLGTLTITSVNTYTDLTTISAGTLILTGSGSIANSSTIDVQHGTVLQVGTVTGGFVVPPAQTLKGNGTITGDATIQGTLLPGPSIGSLIFSNGLVLAGNAVMEISKTGSVLSNDSLVVSGPLTCGGSLTVTNIGGALGVGNTFTLFNAAALSGSFANLKLPLLTPGLMWDSTQLTINGTIAVSPLAPPQVLPAVLNGSQLLLKVQSAVNFNYVLQATPSVAPATWTSLSTNVGSGGILNISAPFDPLQAGRFFRLMVY